MPQLSYRDVQKWSMGGNDRFGDCTAVALANLIDLRMTLAGTSQVVGEAEAELLYARETGWTAQNPGSDKGAVLETVIKDFCANGWPSDPLIKPFGYREITFYDLTPVIRRSNAVMAWLMLPLDADGESYDFTDGAVARNAPGEFAHAVLVVDPGLVMVTWAQIQHVSPRWAAKYFKQFFEIEWPLVTV